MPRDHQNHRLAFPALCTRTSISPFSIYYSFEDLSMDTGRVIFLIRFGWDHLTEQYTSYVLLWVPVFLIEELGNLDSFWGI